MKQKRFITPYEEGALDHTRILVDSETGVHYLFVREGYAGGLTPLLDRNGNVVVHLPEPNGQGN